jgi:DNA polymerase-3 subunit gamma/tau
MSYQIIYRKYRPQTFASIVGQEAIVITLKNALRSGRLAHAYLFCGCRGTGKTTFARIFAKALNCTHLTEDMEPCNACPSCLDVNAGRSLDVLEIDGASNRGIDDIRNLNETVGYAPALGKYKIYIIDEVHMLTKEAFNALLKTLEEPPPHVKFFFATTEPHKVLPTIISRCQRYDLNRIVPHLMIEKLKHIVQEMKIACEEEVFYLISHLSEGSLRDAESLLDQIICSTEAPITAEKITSILGLIPRRSFFALDRAFETQNLSFAFELAQEVFASGKDLTYFLETVIDHYRTLLHIKLGQSSAIFHPIEKENYKASSLIYTEEQCLYILDYLIQWQQQLNKIPFKRIFLEMLLLHILRSKYRLSSATLVKRLIDLESKIPVPSHPAEKKADTSPADEHPHPMPEISLAKAKSEECAPVRTHTEQPIPEIKEQAIPLEKVEIAKEPVTLETSSNVSEPVKAAVHPSRYQTLLQFAAIELEGTIKKEV